MKGFAEESWNIYNYSDTTSLQNVPGPIDKLQMKYEIIYQLDAIEYLFVFFQLDIFRAYKPIFRSNGCYSFFTYAAYGVLGVVRCQSWGVCVLVASCTTTQLHQVGKLFQYFKPKCKVKLPKVLGWNVLEIEMKWLVGPT